MTYETRSVVTLSTVMYADGSEVTPVDEDKFVSLSVPAEQESVNVQWNKPLMRRVCGKRERFACLLT